MVPAARPDPHPGPPELRNAAIVARAAGAEEEAGIASAATPDWAIAPTPIPPDTTDSELVALWLHGKSSNTVRGLWRGRCGLPTLHRQAAARYLPLGSAALRGQPRRRARHPWPPAQDAQIAAVVRDPDGVLAIQRRRRDPRARAGAEARRADPQRTPGLRVYSRRSKIGRATTP
jgi:hypothetical protein